MRAIVIGGSIAGSAAAIGLARAGVEVTILESDATPLPSDPRGHDPWARPGAPHVSQAHAFLSLFVRTMAELAPDVLKQIEDAGVIVRGSAELIPPSLRGEPDPRDDDLVVINSRRSLVESLLRRSALSQPGVEVQTGVSVSGLSAQTMDGIPHVKGVVTSEGRTIPADVVLAAVGRRTDISPWLEGIGGRMGLSLRESTNTLYFTRHYRLKGDSAMPPLNNGFSTVAAFPFFTVLMFPGDNGVAQVAMGSLPEDTPMKGVRRADAFQAVAQLAPGIAPWVHPNDSEPISDVAAMGNLENLVNRLVASGKPLVTGLHLVGDAAALTNPQYGRGVSHAVGHAWHVTKTILAMPDDPRAQALAIDDEVERMLLPSYNDSVRLDRSRTKIWREGAGLPPLPEDEGTEPPFTRGQALRASVTDPVVFRAMMRGGFMLEPPGSWLRDPSIVSRIVATEAGEEPTEAEGLPTRDEVLTAIANAR